MFPVFFFPFIASFFFLQCIAYCTAPASVRACVVSVQAADFPFFCGFFSAPSHFLQMSADPKKPQDSVALS